MSSTGWMEPAQRLEHEVAQRIRQLGHTVEPFGQGLLHPSVRDYLKDTESLLRWLPDLAVMISAYRQIVLVDAKGCKSSNTGNHSIEMRSILGGIMTDLPVWYVCQDFRALSMASIVEDGPDSWCCEGCRRTFVEQPDQLPKRCPEHARRQRRGSGTPYVLVSKQRCLPLERAFPPAFRDGAEHTTSGVA